MAPSQFPLDTESPKHEYRLSPNSRLAADFGCSDRLLLPLYSARENRKRVRMTHDDSMNHIHELASDHDLIMSDYDSNSQASGFSHILGPAMPPRLASSALPAMTCSANSPRLAHGSAQPNYHSHQATPHQSLPHNPQPLSVAISGLGHLSLRSSLQPFTSFQTNPVQNMLNVPADHFPTQSIRDNTVDHPPKRRLTSLPSSNEESSPAIPHHPELAGATNQALVQLHIKASASINSPTRTPVSDYDEEDLSNQLPLPSPSASPSQDSPDKASFLDCIASPYASVPQTQNELVEYITALTNHLDERGHNFLVYRLLQHVNRLALSTFNGLIHNSLRRDLIGDLPREITYRILSYLDHQTLLNLALVCKKWNAIINNTTLWLGLLQRDKLITSQIEIESELSNSESLIRGWAPPRPFSPPSAAQVLYKKRRIIYQRWMDPEYQPKRISVKGHASKVVTCLQHDDDKIITGLEGRPISIYCTKTGNLLRVLEGHEGGVWAMKYVGNTLVTGSTDRTVRIWNIKTGKCTHILRGHTSTVRCLDIIKPVVIGKDVNGTDIVYPKEPLLVTGSRDHNLHVWRLPMCNEGDDADVDESGNDTVQRPYDSGENDVNPYLVAVLTGHIQLVRSVTGHGNIIISGSYDSTVRVWDLMDNAKCKHVLTGHHDKVYSIVMDYASKICYSASMDSTVNVWNFETGLLLRTLEGHTSLVGLLDLVDGVLVSAAADFSLRIWDPKTGKNYSKLEGHASPITCFEHDGLRVVSGSERMLKLWDTKTGAFTRDMLTDVTGGIWQVRIDYRRCVAAVQRYTNDDDYDTFIEILDFSACP